MTAIDAFIVLQTAILSAGSPPPCTNSTGLWFSSLPSERAEAATRCHPCPVVNECGRYASAGKERHGVWGARDMTKTTSANRRDTAA